MKELNFLLYTKAQADKKAAYELYNYAGQKLENAQIRERLAEIKSQYEPINSLLDGGGTMRDMLYAIAHYVVVGRLPNKPMQESEEGS